MKKFFYILLALSLVLVSCKKEEIKPVEEEQEEAGQVDEEIRIYGKWVLVDATMYVENLETGSRTQYNHFDDTQKVSTLRYDGNPEYEFEIIEKDSTTWSFYPPDYVPGYGEFVLDGDTANPMGFYVTKSDWTIMEHPTSTSYDDMQLGGSSRPIEAYVYDYGEQIVDFYVQIAYENIDGYNCKYFTEMRMKKIEEW
jgi:hypothetical protein